MEKIDLKAILAKHCPLDESSMLLKDIPDLLKEVWNLAVDKCKENAKLEVVPYDEEAWEHIFNPLTFNQIRESENEDGEIGIDLQSIEQVKEMI